MTLIKYFCMAICKCGRPLDTLIRDDNGCWETVECECGLWYDTDTYQKQGGIAKYDR